MIFFSIRAFIFAYVLCLHDILCLFVDLFVYFYSDTDYNTMLTVVLLYFLLYLFCSQIILRIMEFNTSVKQDRFS